jgi:small subunit ribosomal protein S29
MPAEDAKRLGATTERLPNALIPKNFLELQQLFGEHSFLIRQPALEVISYLNQIKEKESTSNVNNLRFILWGENGCGKSTSLAHIEHFCHNDGRIILNFHKFKLWFTHYKEMA